MKQRKLFIALIAVIVVAFIAGRLYSRQAAVNFGQHLAAAFSVIGRDEFAKTDGLRDFFSDPDLVACEKRTQNLSFFGGRYNDRISELKSGMIYLSEQISLPEKQRFEKPLSLNYLSIDSSDHSDQGVAAAAEKLILNYRSHL